MQMGSGGTSRHADRADARSGGEALSRLHVDGGQMAVHAAESASVIDGDRIAVEKILAGIDDRAGGRYQDRRARRCGDVHAGMRVARFAIEYTAHSERTAARTRYRLAQIQGFGRRLRELPESTLDAYAFAGYPREVCLG